MWHEAILLFCDDFGVSIVYNMMLIGNHSCNKSRKKIVPHRGDPQHLSLWLYHLEILKWYTPWQENKYGFSYLIICRLCINLSGLASAFNQTIAPQHLDQLQWHSRPSWLTKTVTFQNMYTISLRLLHHSL